MFEDVLLMIVEEVYQLYMNNSAGLHELANNRAVYDRGIAERCMTMSWHVSSPITCDR